MTDSSPQTITLPLPAIEGMTIAFQGVNYLRPEKMLDFATISPAPVRAVTPLALLYSTVGVLRRWSYASCRSISAVGWCTLSRR